MTAIKIKPVEVIGHCRAGLTLDDEFLVDGTNLLNPRQSGICIGALSHLPPAISTLQRGKRFFAHARCQNCTGLGQENRVVFLLGYADRWALCECMSEYSRLCLECGESALARQLKVEAAELQSQGAYTKALQRMEAALEELKSAGASRETWLYYNG